MRRELEGTGADWEECVAPSTVSEIHCNERKKVARDCTKKREKALQRRKSQERLQKKEANTVLESNKEGT